MIDAPLSQAGPRTVAGAGRRTAIPPPWISRIPRMLRDVGIPLLLTRLLLVLITVTAPRWQAAIPEAGRFLSPTPRVGGPVLTRWYHWDAAWYLRIAGNGPRMGYSSYIENKNHGFGAFAFFPLYPLTVRIVGSVVPGALDAVPAGGAPRAALLVTALVVANVAFLLALLALYALVQARAGPAAARRAAWLLCLFPTTIFFSAPYSESMFLLWLVLFFLALDQRRWWLAGLCGALAAATRSLGAALVLPYVLAWWQANRRPLAGDRGPDSRTNPSRWKRLLPVVIVPLGLVAYMAYLQLAWGDPLLFQKAEKAWSRVFAPPWVGIYDGFTWSLRSWPHLGQPNWRGLTDAFYAVVFLALTAWAWRALDWAERAYALVFWIYVLCSPNLPGDHSFSDTLISMARFLLVLLPLWIWFARSRWRTLAIGLPAVVLLLFYAARWVNGGWIG